MARKETESMIDVNGLTKSFNGFIAVDRISFNVKKGELFGILGPNGAGKSTTIYMLTTVLRPTAGKAMVNGFEISAQPEQVRKSIGITFQDSTIDNYLSAKDNLDIHGRLYGMSNEDRAKRIDEVLELVELSDWKNQIVRKFSGGMKRRLEIARGLMHKPQILFLDEPTLGLDPQTRRHIWDYIVKLKNEGITIILTTHYLEEADALCDRIAILDHGKIVALDTPSRLKNVLKGNVLEVESPDLDKLESVLIKSKICSKPRKIGGKLILSMEKNCNDISRIIDIAKKNKISLESIGFHRPSLEDVFIYYTGKSIREEKAEKHRGRMRGHGHGM